MKRIGIRAAWLTTMYLAFGCGGSGTTSDAPPSGGAGAAGSSGQAHAGTGGASAGSGGAKAGSAGKAASAGTAGAGQGGKAGQAGAAGQAGVAGAGQGGGSGQAGSAAAGAGGAQGGQAGGGGQGGEGGGAGNAGQAGKAGAGGADPCGGCKPGFTCKYGQCLPPLGGCATHDDCPGDSYCDLDKICVPYGVPPSKTNDPTCEKPAVVGVVTPTVQCQWTGPAAGDPTASLTEIYTAPMVAELNLDLDPGKIQPSIIATTFDFNLKGRTGMLRVFDGRTCQEQLRIGGPDDPDAANNRPGYGSQWAIGDLDGDVGTSTGHPEIVGFRRKGWKDNDDPLNVVAFAVDTSVPASPKLVRKWVGRDCSGDTPIDILDNAANLGIGLWDLDDDGKPEAVVGKLVFDSTGCVLNPGATVDSYSQLGLIGTVADVDLDGKPDLIHYDGVYGWDTASKDWTPKPWGPPVSGLTAGNVAVANFGAFSEIPGHPKTDPLPEIVVVANGKVRVQTLKGEVIFGPLDVLKGGRGGPPTIGDFDGDGQVEFAAAGGSAYTVYDPDCAAAPDPAARPGGKCVKSGSGLPAGVLWTQPSQDMSSNITGSSIFDFNGDGKAEAVYRDECFLRVYDGATGAVIYSAPASSGTGYELPVIVDADGDFATEIVVPRTRGISCPAGPDPLNPNSGDFKLETGFVILRDPQDRWVSSRPIWNQHAYSVTNVDDEGRIPRSSLAKRNWEQPGLNNFRQNTQGSTKATALADLTVELQDADLLCSGVAGTFTVKARVCNRGTNPVQDGAKVEFTTGPMGGAKAPLCSESTTKFLLPGDCTLVSCTGAVAAGADVYVAVDPAGDIADCHPGNNDGASARKLCGKE